MIHRFAIRIVTAAAALFLCTGAHAQLFRAYLAPTGLDTNPCTLPAPCRLLPAALAAVATGGEIWMLDSANYNTAPVAITKSVTILAVPGVVGSVLATGGNAINIATTGVKVVLRNLMIVPQPGAGGADGIHMTNGAALNVENCVIANMPFSSIYVNTPAIVRITDSTIRGNGDLGIFLRGGSRTTVWRTTVSGNVNQGFAVWGTTGTTTTADIADSVFDGNSTGIFAFSTDTTATVKVSVRDSKVYGNFYEGVLGSSISTGPVLVTVANSVISGNGAGIKAVSGPVKMWVTGNTVTHNDFGLHQIAGVIETPGNNAIRNNVQDKAGTIALAAIE